MRKRKLLVALGIEFGLVLIASATVPVVTNVVASQRVATKLVDIFYDVSDAEGDLLKINVEVSNNAGQTYAIPASSFSGDYGNNVSTGISKHIVWDSGVDWNGEYSDVMRVKVIANDGKSLPGLQWSHEIPAGGFLMGQDGGPEGIGPSRHVNIPWSYWLSKYEITAAQYVEYLNIALAAGEITRVGSVSVYANSGKYVGVPGGATLIKLDALRDVVWNITSFEYAPGKSNFPVRVSWYGALAFAQHFGYDLPTDAEWEKAARGSDNEDGETHQVYPWGNSLGGGFCNYYSSADPWDAWIQFGVPGLDWAQDRFPYGTTAPVGYYRGNQTPIGPDMANAYALYDMSGNANEWCRSKWIVSVESYPQVESLTDNINLLSGANNRIIRGGGCYSGVNNAFSDPDYYTPQASLMCYYRDSRPPAVDATSTYTGNYSLPSALDYRPDIGFRVVRRAP